MGGEYIERFPESIPASPVFLMEALMRVSPVEYRERLQSPEWQALREIVLTRANSLCDVPGCLSEPTEVHHLTYDRIGREDWRDLVAVCRPCHLVLHDPASEPEALCVAAHKYEWVQADPCSCPFCTYRRKLRAANLRLRRELTRSLNVFLLERNEAVAGSKPATLKQEWCIDPDLPPSLVCPRTGVPANTEAACGCCDACNWVAALETAFREEESEPE